MCNFELKYDSIRELFGIDYSDYFATEHGQLDGFVEDRLLRCTDKGLYITDIGRTFIRNIAMVYDAYLGKPSDGSRPTFSRTI